jgi:hypothetical protein
VYDVHEVPETAAKTIQLPDDKGVALPERLQASSEARSVVFSSRGGIAVEVPLAYAYRKERIPLQVEHLRAISFGYPHVAD